LFLPGLHVVSMTIMAGLRGFEMMASIPDGKPPLSQRLGSSDKQLDLNRTVTLQPPYKSAVVFNLILLRRNTNIQARGKTYKPLK
jgi:hypothetical protein